MGGMARHLLLVLIVGCGGAPAPAPAAPVASVTSPCVVNAAESSQTDNEARCWIGSECFVRPMTPPSPGDGIVDLVCEGTRCRCTRTVAVTKREEIETFTAPRSCADSEMARALLVEHCLHGTPLLPEHGDGGGAAPAGGETSSDG